MLGLLVSQMGRHVSSYLRTRTVPKVLTLAGFVLVFAFVMGGTFEILFHGLSFIASNQFFGNAVSLYIYEMILLVVVAMAAATALIEGTFSLFRNTKDTWIMATPGNTHVPGMVLAQTIIGGAFLPLTIIIVPTLAAMQAVYHIGVSGILLGFCAILLIVAATVIATFVLLFVVTKLLSMVRLARLSFVLTIMVLIVAMSAGFVWHIVSVEGATLLFPDYSAATHAADAQNIISHFEFLPSHPAAMVLYDAQNTNTTGGLKQIGILVLLTAVLYAMYRGVSVWYLRLWQDLQAEPQSGHAYSSANARPKPFPRYLAGATGAFFEKEVLVIMRTGRDFMWLLFMLFLWLFQIATDLYIRKLTAGTAIGTFPLVIQALEVSVIAYFLGAFTLRFAFPTFSTEGKTAWIVAAAPLSLKRIYTAKLIFFCSFFGILSVIVAVLHSSLLALSGIPSIGLVILSLVMGITITSFSIMLGILFPSFESNDPQALSTSLPGLTLVFIVLIYGAVGSYAFLSLLKTGNAVEVVSFVVVSVVLLLMSVVVSRNKLKTFEFISSN